MTNLLNLNENRIALQGYDPVSYFSGGPVQGREDLQLEYEGAIYQFSTQTNKTAFEAEPDAYKPQYGGFCAVAVSEGKTFPIDPTSYLVSEGNLYLFYNGKLGNTQPDWEADAQTRKRNADAHWGSGNLSIVYPKMDY